MSTWVVDTSALVQAFIEDEQTPYALALIARLALEDPDELHTAEITLAECANVLWKQVRFHKTPQDEAITALENLLVLPLYLHSMPALLPRALRIGLDQQIAIYDAVSISLAELLACPLITVDQRQIAAAQATGVAVNPLTDFTP